MKQTLTVALLISSVVTTTTFAQTPVDPRSTATYQQAQQLLLDNQKRACEASGYYWLANNTCSKTSASTSATLQRFQPNMTIQQNSNGKSFGGVSFSGVGATIAGCSGAGQQINNALTKLGDKMAKSESGFVKGIGKALGIGTGGSGLGGGKVPVDAKSVEDQQKTSNKKESCLDALAYTLSKQALSQVTNKTLNWVNTGFGGNPFYVRDMDSFLRSIEKETFQSYINATNRIENQIIGQTVNNSLISIFSGRAIPAVTRSAQNEVEKQYNNFSNDFTKGGWASWLNATQGDQNPLGQFMIVSEQLSRDYAQKEQNTTQELTQGQGFLSQKKCVEYAQAPSVDDDYDFNLNADGSLKCLKYETVTPGSVIAEQTKQVTSSSIRQLEAADELNEVLGAFFDQLLNQLFNKGLQTLGRNSGDNFGNTLSGFGGSGSNTVTGSNGQPINGTGTGVALPYNQVGSGFFDDTFNISNPRHITAVLRTQKNFLNQALDSRAALQKIVPLAGRLDYCLPGPNANALSTAQTNSDEFFTAFDSGASVIGGTTNLPVGGGGIFGGFSINGNGSRPISSGPFSLSDKLRNTNVAFDEKVFLTTNTPFTTSTSGGFLGIFGGTTTIDFSQALPRFRTILEGYVEDFVTAMNQNYNTDVISAAFESTQTTDAAKAFARGYVKDAYNQSRLLPDYVTSTISTDNEYQDAIDATEIVIPQLEEIRNEVFAIVTTARTRYIAEKRAQGITINTTCLDQNYDIRNTAVVGAPRVETDANDLLDAVEQARVEFYNGI